MSSSSQLPNTAIPKPLPDDDDDVSWALQTAAVQWGRGAYEDAIVWLRRAAESAVDGSKWSRAADLNAMATRLEKQIAKLPTQPQALAPSSSAAPAAPQRAAILPSLPIPTPSVPLSAGIGSLPTGRRQTSGGILPVPPPRLGKSVPAPSSSGRPSFEIAIEAGLGELTEDELRAIESEGAAAAGIPRRARDGWGVSQPSRGSDGLPVFDLEPSHPQTPAAPNASSSPLPAFSLEMSTRPPAAGPSATSSSSIPVQGSERSASSSSSSLPSFPLDAGTSSLPPVSKWPRLGSPGTSHLPPHPALPTLEAVPPSKPFQDDGDDGAPGIDEPVLPDHALEELEPLEVLANVGPAGLSEAPASAAEIDDLDLVEIDGVRTNRGAAATPPSLVHLSVRAGRASTRSRTTSAPLPPALPDARGQSSVPETARTAPRLLSSDAPAFAGSSRPPVPARSSPSPSNEPRMPNRALSYAAPLDFGGKLGSLSSADRTSTRPATEPSPGFFPNRATSNSPMAKRIDAAESVSVAPPPSARSLEPEDLPTVSSPTLSRPPPEAHSRPPSERLSEGRFGETWDGQRRLSFRFEEPKTLEKIPEERKSSDSALPPLPDAGQTDQVEEPLADLPPVAIRPSVESQAPGVDSGSDAVILSGVRLADVRGFSELPVSAHRMLAQTASIETLATGEEVSFFSVALVLDGWVALMPAIADTTCATAVVGEVVFTEGTLSDGLMLRVVAGQDDVAVATWDAQAVAEATKDCPWVADDLKLLADGFQALAGACLGPLGDRLDDSLRSIVTSRCEIRTLMPGEQMCAAGKPVPGMHIIGGGEIELVDENDRVAKTYGTGEFLFAPQVLAGGVTPFAARAGGKGALVLFAPRMAAHELLVSVPPLLEILAE